MNFWEHIPKPIVGLSPMDGITDASFRFITAKHGGPDVTLTEFVNVQSAFFSPHILFKDFTYSEIERPVVAQIYGKTPELFYKVAHIVCELGFDGLDINMGCPAKKVAASGCGAALIRTPELARSIIRAAHQGIDDWLNGQTLSDLKIAPEVIQQVRIANKKRTGVETVARKRRLPLSVKTRLGYDCVVIDDWIKTLLDENLAVISLHGRTLEQGYKGDADWEAIGRAAGIAKNSGTLILGNGDLQDMKDICRRVRETNVNGVLLGRAAQGNPWIFRTKDDVKQALRSSHFAYVSDAPVSLKERFEIILEHSHHFETYCGRSRFNAIRKHLIWYCRGFRGAAEMRAAMVRVNSARDVAACLNHFIATAGEKLELSTPAAPEAPLPHMLPIGNLQYSAS
ncbi:MAG TPA: tRNA-dihydrouridine synthase [Candidatus Acidoferrales bacterium]|nr:tRNA-dihydrouridine synthase [Candidatus Acidoferrales bacterium]